MKRLAGVLGVIVLTGCGSVTAPVLVVSSNGDRMQGTTTASLSGGSFEVSGRYAGKALSCTGTYNALDTAKTIAIPVSCSDGRNGMVTATRDASGMNGAGDVRLDDGSRARFVFGNAALARATAEKPPAEAMPPVARTRFPDPSWVADQSEPYLRCGRDRALRLAILLPDESPSDIASTARLRCSSQWATFVRTVEPTLPPSTMNEIRARAERSFRDLVTAVTIDIRERARIEEMRRRPAPRPGAEPPSVEREA